jgi:hypothetical protein
MPRTDPLPTDPALTVVVTVVSGGESARKTIARLTAEGRDWLEVLVPLEAGHPDRGALAAEHPKARFPDVDLPAGAATPEHERYDRRRSAGLRESRGAVVAIVEDHGTPAPDWPERVRAAHARLPHAAIGGVVANGVARAFQDSAWLCDFGRYAPPQAEGPRATLTDVNVSYKREPLLAVRASWEPRFHEPVVHGALRARSDTLWLDPSLVVAQERPPLGFGAALAERFSWGRLFGALRASSIGPPLRLLYAIASLFIAPVLWWRIARQSRGRIPAGRLLRATPWLVVMLVSWCFGESLGTLSGGYNPLPKKDMR